MQQSDRLTMQITFRLTSASEQVNETASLRDAPFLVLMERHATQGMAVVPALRRLPVRLLGFGVQKLEGESAIQQSLFDQQERQKNRELDQVSDQITAKFGKLAIRRGQGMGKERK